jgi:hypothetical protein
LSISSLLVTLIFNQKSCAIETQRSLRTGGRLGLHRSLSMCLQDILGKDIVHLSVRISMIKEIPSTYQSGVYLIFNPL